MQPAGATRDLGGQHVDLFDLRRLGQQIGGLGHQRGGDGAVEVGLAAGVAGEGVEDPERRRAEPQREPDGRLGFLLGEREPAR